MALEFTASTQALTAALCRVAPAIDKRASIEALKDVLISASSSGLLITARHLQYDMTITTRCDAFVVQPGDAVVRFALLSAGVNQSKATVIDARMAGRSRATLALTCGDKENTIVLPHMGYADLFCHVPLSEPLKDEASCLIDGHVLRHTLSKAVDFVATDETHPILKCVRFSSVKESLEVAASNTAALSVGYVPTETMHWPEDVSYCVHGKSLAAIIKIIKGDQRVHIRFSRDVLVIDDGQTSFCLNVSDDKFPNYWSVVPTHDDDTPSCVLSGPVLSDAIRNVTAYAQLDSNHVQLERSERPDGTPCLKVHATSDEGTASILIEAAFEGGKWQPCGLNYEYLHAAIADSLDRVRLSRENVTGHPLVVKAQSSITPAFCVIMPMVKRS